MTGPEHYKAAEADIRAGDHCFESAPDESSRNYQSAQAHALLAIAAATALGPVHLTLNHAERRAWTDVAGVTA